MNDFDNEEQSMRTMRGDTKEGTLGRIDQYEIIRKLGGGGFGVVYLVRDTQSDVDYAIKTLHPLLKSNPEEMENLRSQFKLVSKLIHSHIAPAMILHPVREVVYSSEEVRKELRLSPDDFVMVMKYAPGVTLSQWRKQFPNGVVPVDKAINICKQVASALDYAHSEKIIHRDIKPSNIMVETREDKSVIARVLDFGLAAEIRSSMSRVSTEKGDTSGTRPYMAPEQWQGKKQGSATDQYALACMFYELVSSAVPFAGAFETGDFQIMLNSVKSEVPDPLDELTSDQNNAVLKALSKDMKQRFASCSDFIAALNGEKTNSIVSKIAPSSKVITTTNDSSKTIICKKCGFENNKTSLFCKGCGEKIERFDTCQKCGKEIDPNQKFCDKCGAKTLLCIAEEKAEAERRAHCEEEERKAREKAEAEGKFSVAGIDMVRIPDSTEHKGLYFGMYQVTQGQWLEIMGNNPSYHQPSKVFLSRVFGSNVEELDVNRPVEQVSWDDCQEFVKKLNSRTDVKQAGITFFLPTQEEWEYACRAGSTGKYGLLADGREGAIDEMGWYGDNSRDETHPVGQKKPNAWGLYDMHGNVWEWTASADGGERIRCGGSYCNSVSNCAANIYGRDNLYSKFHDLGFRLVARCMTVEGKEEECKACEEIEYKVQDESEPIEKVIKEKREKSSAFFKRCKSIFIVIIFLTLAVVGKNVYNTYQIKQNAIPNLIDNMVRMPDSSEHKGLYFGKYEVTQAQWQAIMGNNPSNFTGDSSRPVENVSWYDCQEFIKKLNVRTEVKQAGLIFSLPTTEQWEYACRAGSRGKYGLLADGREGTIDEMGWYEDNSGSKTHPVGQKKPNAWGLYDMHGNVWEWTASADGENRFRYGGCYFNSVSDCGGGSRYWSSPDRRSSFLGFRLAARRIVDNNNSDSTQKEANSQFKPALVIKAKCDGKLVSGKDLVQIGGKQYDIGEAFEVIDGKNYGNAEIRCKIGGKNYSGQVSIGKVTWKGTKEFVIDLKEIKEQPSITVADIEMVCIPDNTTHKGLYFGKYEVTQAQWKAIMGNLPFGLSFNGDLSCPVGRVSWYDCHKFIKKLNARADVKQAGIIFRLPTKAEWEYACRAGSTGKYGLLADGREGTLDEMGWYKDNSGGETHPVGQKKPNAWGLYDMHGNVEEWTATAPSSGAYVHHRFTCGGDCSSIAFGCEAGVGGSYLHNPEYRFPDSLGFRLAASRTVY